ncbi:hypothetical protein V8B97DRAFT_1920272 [Scleroderma yunnanense]
MAMKLLPSHNFSVLDILPTLLGGRHSGFWSKSVSHGMLKEVQQFTRLVIVDTDKNAEFADVSLIQMYSAPNPELLQHSNHVMLASQLMDTISVIHVKQLTSVIAIISQQMALPSGTEQEVYCMMEHPGVYHKGDDDDTGQDVE